VGRSTALASIGSLAVARRAFGEETGPLQTTSAHVSFLAAAVGEDVHATTVLIRGGRTACFAETSVATLEGAPLARISTVVGHRNPPSDADPPLEAVVDDGADPGPMGPFVGAMPFTAARHIAVEHMAGGRSRLVMPFSDANADADGIFHEGAILALLDTTGAMAAWGVTGPGRFRASTVALQASVLDGRESERLVARGRVVHHAGELFWSAVEVGDAATDRPVAIGTVVYRIAT
jgi:uncharacterized protein (TIGR00369 family)